MIVFVVVAPLAKIVCAFAALFANVIVPATLLSVPSAGVAVNAGVAPARTSPAAPVMEIVPVVVIVPPARGAVVAIDETVALLVLHVEHEMAPAELIAIGLEPFRPALPTFAMGMPVGIAAAGIAK